MINLLPEVYQDLLFKAVEAHPELFGLGETELKLLLIKQSARPNKLDHTLRLGFWKEYDQAQHENRKMNMPLIHAGICEKPQFSQIWRFPHKVAWITNRPMAYDVMMSEALEFGISQLRDILELDHSKEGGKIDTKLIEAKIKIVKMLDDRVKGAVLQRIEQKTLGVNVHTTDKQVASLAMAGSMEEIERKLADLRKKERDGEGIYEIKDVEAQDVTGS